MKEKDDDDNDAIPRSRGYLAHNHSPSNSSLVKNPLYQSVRRQDEAKDSVEIELARKTTRSLEHRKRFFGEFTSSITSYRSIPGNEISQHNESADLERDQSDESKTDLLNTPVTSGSHTASIMTSIVNTVSTLIGAGVLGIPYALSRMGWILGTISLLLCALLSYTGLHLLSECTKKLDSSVSYTFYAVAEIAVPSYTKLIDFAIMLKGIGVATSYLIVITDSLPKAFRPFLSAHWNHILFENRINCILISYLFILPLSYLPHLESLRHTSLLSLIMIVFLVGLILIYSLHLNMLNPCIASSGLLSEAYIPSQIVTLIHAIKLQMTQMITIDLSTTTATLCEGKTYLFPFLLSPAQTSPQVYHLYDTFHIFPIFLFSFTCHQNTFNIINELQQPTAARINRVFTTSVLFTLLLFFIISYSAYWTFGDRVESDVLKSYPENTLNSVCRLCMAIVVITHYPLQLFSSRKCALTLWKSLTNGRENPWRFVLFSMAFNIVTFLLAAALENLGLVFSLLGTVTSTLVVLLLPSIFYLQLFPDGPTWKRLASKVIFVFGWTIMIVSLVFNCLGASNSH